MRSNFLIVVFVGLAIFGGIAAATDFLPIFSAFSAFFIAMLLAVNPYLLFFVTLIASMVVGGLVEFYFGIGQANWMSSLLGVQLLLLAFVYLAQKHIIFKLSGITWLVLVYFLILISSSIINENSFIQVLTGIRNYLPFLGVFFALQSFVRSEKKLRRYIHALLLVSLLQLPFCLHQAVFVSSIRQKSAAVVGGDAEAVVGTFGGNMLGGGYTGEMAVFMLIASCLSFVLASKIRHGRILAWAISLSAIACISLAETKIVFLLTPIVLVMVFYEDIRSSPRKIFGLLAAMSVVIGGVGGIYAWRFWSSGFDEFWHAFTYSFDPEFMVDEYHRGRFAALIHWWDSNVKNFEFIPVFFGHGMASTLEASRILGVGNAVKTFGQGLDAHAASKLLWDGGLLGFGFLCWILVYVALKANRLARIVILPDFHRSVMKVARAAMFCFAVMLPYQVSLVGGAPMQFLFWFFVGYVEYWSIRVNRNKNVQIHLQSHFLPLRHNSCREHCICKS